MQFQTRKTKGKIGVTFEEEKLKFGAQE